MFKRYITRSSYLKVEITVVLLRILGCPLLQTTNKKDALSLRANIPYVIIGNSCVEQMC